MALSIKGEPELTDPFNLLINVKSRILKLLLFKRTFLW